MGRQSRLQELRTGRAFHRLRRLRVHQRRRRDKGVRPRRDPRHWPRPPGDVLVVKAPSADGASTGLSGIVTSDRTTASPRYSGFWRDRVKGLRISLAVQPGSHFISGLPRVPVRVRPKRDIAPFRHANSAYVKTATASELALHQKWPFLYSWSISEFQVTTC